MLLDFLSSEDATELQDICNTASDVFTRYTNAFPRRRSILTIYQTRMLSLQVRFNRLLTKYDDALGERNLYLHMMYTGFNSWLDTIDVEVRDCDARHQRFCAQRV